MSRARLLDIDRATGLTMILVVLGHFATEDIQAGAEWYNALKSTLYSFHMPFFMYLSGIVTYYTYTPIASTQDYKAYVLKKFKRLIPPYLLFSLIIFVGKIAVSAILATDNPVGSFHAYFKVLYAPQVSFSAYLWYVYVLFEFCLLLPLLLLILGKIEYILIFAAGIHYFSCPDVLGLNMICRYLLYFSIGAVCVKYYTTYTRYLDRMGWFFLVLFLGAAVYSYQVFLHQYRHSSAILVPLPGVMIALLSIPAIHSFVRMHHVKNVKLLYHLAAFSFPIYLMNTIAIGTMKGAAMKLTGWDYHEFHILVPLLLLSGLFVPIVMKKYLFKYVPLLDGMVY